jgi:hypothetical protein
MYGNWLVVCAMSAWVWRLVARSTATRATRWLVMLIANLLLFSAVQAMNWTYGIQLAVFLTLAATTAAVVVAAAEMPERRKFIWCSLLCFVATFSMGNGLLAWGVTYPVLFAAPCVNARQRAVMLAGFPLLSSAVVAAYFAGYQSPAPQSPLTPASHHPLQMLLFALIFLGGPLAPGTGLPLKVVAGVIGALGAGCVCVAAGYVALRRERTLLNRMLPSLMIAMFVLLNAAAAAIGRVAVGLDEALALRYFTIPLTLYVALVILAVEVGTEIGQRRPSTARAMNAAVMALLGTVAVLAILSTLAGVEIERSIGAYRRAEKAALTFVRFSAETDLRTSYVLSLEEFRNRAEALGRAGLLRPPLMTTADVSSIEHPGGDAPAGSTCGDLELVLREAGGITRVEGWATLPWRRRPADAVLLAVEGPDGRSTMFATARVGEARPDIAARLQSDRVERSGWTRLLPPLEVPSAGSDITAWAYDVSSNTACRLAGRKKIGP